jgi:hypothetical protein
MTSLPSPRVGIAVTRLEGGQRWRPGEAGSAAFCVGCIARWVLRVF